MMQVVYTHCAGLDVHKKTVTACVITPNQKGGWNREVRTFETHTNSLLNMLDWLLSFGCTQVAMESTGEYWRPVFNIYDNAATK
ncbi:MAG: IS110 family transposase [Fischerella sp. CENA71]|nr:IS110 family transposase [Fischerella sp. CENA71]